MTGQPAPTVSPLTPGAAFRFRCHPGVICFTECCRELELALSPYDALRLRRALRLSWQDFLETHAIVEQTASDPFPQVFLAMVDDGRASCPFVSEKGCTVYADRPGACRTYPLGRALERDREGNTVVHYVLVTEPHCQGFAEPNRQDVAAWTESQELRDYFEYNDLVAEALQHPFFRNGGRLDAQEADAFLLALYDLEGLRAFLAQNPQELSTLGLSAPPPAGEDLLHLGARWLAARLAAHGRSPA